MPTSLARHGPRGWQAGGMDPTPDGPDTAIRTRNLRKTYRNGAVVAVAGLDLDIPRGGVHGFLGPNGSGKTTTLRMLLGLVRPDAGEMHILGRRVPDELDAVVDSLGAIVEQPRFFPTMSGRRNLALLARGIGTPRARVDEVIEHVGLTGRANDDVRRYSLGMKQRLAIAATLLKDPEVLIFDEPMNGLDPAGMREIRSTMRALGLQGRTVVVSSHVLSEVQQVADTVTIIGRGRMLAQGRVSDILAGDAVSAVRVGVRARDAATAALQGAGYRAIVMPDGALRVEWADADPDRPVDPADVARVLGEAGVWPSELGVVQENLEERFLALTAGEHLTVTQSGGSAARRFARGAA